MPDLVLGWQVTTTLEPKYWLSTDSKPGLQSDADLFRVPAESMATHTAIIAQSGSGKSFFLGRLIEELMLRTRSRCLILDPNADFRKIHKVEGPQLWNNAGYDNRNRSGKLPHESNREQFLNEWEKIPVVIHVGNRGSGKSEKPYRQLNLFWPSVSIEFLGEDIGPLQRSELYHCHAFVRAVHELIAIKSLGTKKRYSYLARAESFLGQAIGNQPEFANAIRDEFVIDDLADKANAWKMLRAARRFSVQRAIDSRISQVLSAAKYVSPEMKRFYFGKLNEFRVANIIEEQPRQQRMEPRQPPRLEVIDLPSLPNSSTRLLAINAVVATEWERARALWAEALSRPEKDDNRVPTFIVVDEAHNVIPDDPRSKAEHVLREQFRTIVAEGRKYGLFLVLVSQRPEKLDPLVVSECENRALMKLSSGSALEAARTRLTLEDLPTRLLSKCLELERGRVLLVGPWSPEGPEIFYSATRRTVEGGRNLNKDWTSAPVYADSSDTHSEMESHSPEGDMLPSNVDEQEVPPS